MEVMPYLRMTRTEFEAVRLELTSRLVPWTEQWCSGPLELEFEAVDVETQALDNSWGQGVAWVAVPNEVQLTAALHVALFAEPVPRTGIHPLADQVVAQARLALIKATLGALAPAEITQFNAGTCRGRSAAVWLNAGTLRTSLLVSPAVLADIVNESPARAAAHYRRVQVALGALPVRLEAVVGTGRISVQDFMSLNAGDVIALDQDVPPMLYGQQGPVAAMVPCTIHGATGVRVTRSINAQENR